MQLVYLVVPVLLLHSPWAIWSLLNSLSLLSSSTFGRPRIHPARIRPDMGRVPQDFKYTLHPLQNLTTVSFKGIIGELYIGNYNYI